MTGDDTLREALAAMAEQYRQDEERRTAEFRAQIARYRAELQALVREVEGLRDALVAATDRLPPASAPAALPRMIF